MKRNLASFVVFAAVLGAQQPPPLLKPGKVEGVVLNSVTNDPVKKATVILQALGQPTNHSTVTDATGHFHFDSVAPGKYFATANREGYIPVQESLRNPWAKPITVAEEQEVKDVAVKLVPLAVVSGHVLDEDGDPVARAQVQALRYMYRRGGARQLNPAGFATTNDLGEYQLLDLEPARYYFLAAVQPRLARLPPHTKSATAEQSYPDTFYPSALQAEQATASQVAAGAQLNGIDFRVHKAPAFHIRGKAVNGSTGEPLRSAMILLRTHGSVFFENVRAQQDGTFDARGVVSGSYTLICQIEQLSSRQVIDVGDHDVDDVQLVVSPPFEISGTVRLEGDPPPAGHRGPMRINLNAIEMGNGAGSQVNADGTFVLKVTPGMYQIYASCDAGAYIKSIHFGDQDVSSGKIDLTQQSSGALNIMCGTDVGQIQGSVQNENGEPAAQVMISVVPEGEHQGRQDLFFQLMSDDNGKFEYRDLAPGDYKVFAWESMDQEMLLSQEFQKAFESRAASVSISPGRKCVGPGENDSGRGHRSRKEQTAMMRIALVLSIAAAGLLAQEPPPPRLSVAGVVNSTTGDPVRKATVILRAKDENGTSYSAASDANGRFVIYDVQPGAYAVSADRQGFESDTDGAPGAPSPSLKVEAGQSVTDVKIKLVPLGVIAGRVLDDEGDPVRGARVEAMAYTYQSGKRQLRSVDQISANDKGEFRLFGLRPGTIYLRASGRNAGRQSFSTGPEFGGTQPSESFTPTYFPSTTEAAHAAPIELSAGAQLRGFDVRLRREMRYSVRGKLPGSMQPGERSMLQIVPRGGRDNNLSFSVRQENDTFEFTDILPGSYIILSTIFIDDKRSVARQAVEVVNADVEGVVLNPAPAAEVSGVVRVEGAPRRPLDNLRVLLRGDSPVMMGQTSAEVKPDGSFVISNVVPDAYEVTVGNSPGAYVKSIRFGDAEVEDGRIDLTQGSGSLTVLLATDVGELEGSVKKSNGNPAVRARITLIAYGKRLGRADLSRSGFTDEQGKFHLRNVAPGEYKLFAWEDVPIGAPQDPEFRKPFEKQAVTVKLEPNGHETALELTAISVKASQRPAQ